MANNNVAEKSMTRQLRVVVIFPDDTQLAGTIHINKNIRLSDALRVMTSPFVALTDVTYGAKEIDTFLLNVSQVRGIIPIE